VGVEKDGAYASRYCYSRLQDAAEALLAWDGAGDPPGPWLVQKGAGIERRNPERHRIGSVPVLVEGA
jgi:hypothetical protein